ncbi:MULTISPECIES: DsbA family protein [unclassified Acidovorax]|uniref:DsbA family protein n=1 Tax=unclassified Acidovorax TaxID=2684926 RepID=UPI002883360E|nr:MULTISPECIES: DsbA family protein [unclassified Acidovorax]
MSKTLYYVFDPLCGWCYGAGKTVAALGTVPGLELRLLPGGLFADDGSRPMNDGFAAFAWSNDQRMERLTGQSFTDRYRTEVLGNHQQRFDSGPATLALTAVALTAPEREADALHPIQRARYVEGQDVTRVDTLSRVLQGLGLGPAAARLAEADAELQALYRQRQTDAQALLGQFGARGVPTFILDTGGQKQLLPAGDAFSNAEAFTQQIAAA